MPWFNFQHHPRRSLRRGMLFFALLSGLLLYMAVAETLAFGDSAPEVSTRMRAQRLLVAWFTAASGLLLTLSCAIPYFRKGKDESER